MNNSGKFKEIGKFLLRHTSLNYLKHSYFINISFTKSVKTLFYLFYYLHYTPSKLFDWLSLKLQNIMSLSRRDKYQKDHLEISASAFEFKRSFYTV